MDKPTRVGHIHGWGTRTNVKTTDHISLRQLRCFVTVAEELHFRRAAEKLQMRQPPLTQRIHDMERDLGVELFHRLANKVELTEAGRMVLRAAKDTLAQAEGVCVIAQRAARGECGTIAVGLTITSLFFHSIQEAMRSFQREYPGIALGLTQVSSGAGLEGLRRRKLDVCLMRAFPAPLPPECEEIVVVRDRLMLVLPAGHRLCGEGPIPLSAVAEENFVGVPAKRGIALYDQIMNLWEKSGLKCRVTQEADNGPAVMAIVAAGFGNAIMPSSLQAIHLDGLVWKTIKIDERWTETSLNLVYQRHVLEERAPAAFIECLRRHAHEESNVIRPFG